MAAEIHLLVMYIDSRVGIYSSDCRQNGSWTCHREPFFLQVLNRQDGQKDD